MNNFDYLKSVACISNQRMKSLHSISFQVLKTIFYFLGIIGLLIVKLNWLGLVTFSQTAIAFSFIFLSIGLLILMIELTVINKLSKFSLKISLNEVVKSNNYNLADYLDSDANSVVSSALEIAIQNKISNVDSSLLIVSINKNSTGRWLYNRMQFVIDESSEKELINNAKSLQSGTNQLQTFSSNFIKVIKSACEIAIKENKEKIDIFDLFLALAKDDEIFKRIIFQLKLEYADLIEIANWQIETLLISRPQHFWQKQYYEEGIGRDWASGYTPILNIYAYDLSQYLSDFSIGYQSVEHQQYIQEMENVLSKAGKNNILLIGEPGVGKKNVVYGFVRKMAKGQTSKSLEYRHVLELDAERLMSANKAQVGMYLTKIFDEAVRAGNIILFIKNFANLIQAEKEQVGAVDASEILMPYLESGRIQIIATTSYEDYQDKISVRSSINNLFDKIKITEPKGMDLVRTLQSALLNLEITNRVIFSYQTVQTLIKLSDRYIHDRPFPEKAIGLAEEAAVSIKNKSEVFVTPDIIEELVTTKTKIPVGEAKDEEKEKLLKLEEFLHQRVIGQDEAISQVANALRRARAGLQQKGKPIGSFLFIGPTGVGKTETAKALAEAYFGSENNMIRFDMTEFQEAASINLLIGSTGAKKEASSQGRLTKAVIDNPYTLILFDELEKAHPNILNLFLQMLDEGKLTDAAGRTVDFSNTIIIATSNAGAEQIRQYLKKETKLDDLKKIILDYLQEKGIFRPEFLNRFDAVVCFKPLSITEIAQVVVLMLNKLNKDMAEKNIKLSFSADAIDKLTKEGYDPILGARPMRRTIQEKVENFLAKELLSGKITRGQTIQLNAEDIK